MLRNCLVVSLLLFLFVVIGGCAKKTVPVADETSAPEAVEAVKPQPVAVSTATVTEQKPPTPPMVETPPIPKEMELLTVLFDYDSYELTAGAQRLLEKNAAWFRLNPRAKVTIEGHCDERGSDEYNLALGERRALATRSYLTKLGIATERLAVISYGEERPASPGHSEEDWELNRRAEFNWRSVAY